MTGLKALNAYALSGDGFKKASSDDVVLNPYRAYLTISTLAKAPASIGIKTVEETSFISAINNTSSIENNIYYNLQGMRVDNPTHGLYICNGKKIYVK